MMLKEAQKGAGSVGAETEYIDLFDLSYTGCRFCLACKRKDVERWKCFWKDDLSPLIDRIFEADALIIGSPYTWILQSKRQSRRGIQGRLEAQVSIVQISNAIKAAALNRKIYRCRFYLSGNTCFSVSGMDPSIICAAVRSATCIRVFRCYFRAVHPLDSVRIEGVLKDKKKRMLVRLSWSIYHVNESAINRTSRVGTL